ncbi:uncharacterized protein EI90DRAFT_3045543 [Cantharellus anzutake]|uniref:uncharacterized protein n=1 Tax=Cantharellus anzutake TaxID=1750568 RepID=UPI00190491B8|nr:uncharacterized protein EI90DRAFT_3045543 [Cantharellus anzutake]KAF8336374.1 hypothetical protein EI90DRAFT_3045543 [Cantharellus anzutake]
MAGITRWLISGLVVLGGYVAFCQEPEDSPDSEDVAASKVVLESSLPVTHSAFSSRTLKKSSRLARPKTGGGAAIGAEQLTVLQRHGG